MQDDFMFTSESVTEGHPDKLCDQISDAIVGHFLRQDRTARLVAECAVSTGLVFIAVKTQSRATVNVTEAARDVIAKVGYEENGFNARSSTVMVSLEDLESDRARVDEETLSDAEIDAIPARDQATVFGFACRQTPAMLPLPIWLAHKLARSLAGARRRGGLEYLAPDGKTQVGVEFRDRVPYRIHSITLIASQRTANVPSLVRLHKDLVEHVIEPVFADEPIRPDAQTRVAINPEGPLIHGGPAVHAGLTGRKTAVDTYGEFARHSGAALSGKDPSRIDRVGAYAARHAAKNIVAAGLADQCEVLLSYSVGLARPVSVQVETYGTGRLPEQEIARRLVRAFDFRVAGVVRQFGLRSLALREGGALYRKLATYGHVGRPDLDLPWERTDRVDAIR